ncbi:hypothetical protein EVAR_41583_1 [Eumeta japonica]|uniref:Uncharacterized protein n=1 Tax=Eumeta variegata TaxID=151549 RepID=A0A4C1Y3H6_EUMVA|nr:hypothetical protein EVAR_41583_1 [Eumeta japonica]
MVAASATSTRISLLQLSLGGKSELKMGPGLELRTGWESEKDEEIHLISSAAELRTLTKWAGRLRERPGRRWPR